MKNTAILRPLTLRTITSWSSPPRTSPKAPTKRSSVWRTVVSTIPVKPFLGIIRLPLIRYHIISILVICKHFFADLQAHKKTRFIILVWQDGSKERVPSKDNDCSGFVRRLGSPRKISPRSSGNPNRTSPFGNKAKNRHARISSPRWPRRSAFGSRTSSTRTHDPRGRVDPREGCRRSSRKSRSCLDANRKKSLSFLSPRS